MEGAGESEISVNTYKIARCHIQEDSNLSTFVTTGHKAERDTFPDRGFPQSNLANADTLPQTKQLHFPCTSSSIHDSIS
jgi:hypothetical protein